MFLNIHVMTDCQELQKRTDVSSGIDSDHGYNECS